MFLEDPPPVSSFQQLIDYRKKSVQMNELSKLERARVRIHVQETRLEILKVTALQSSSTTTPQVNVHGKAYGILPGRRNAKNRRL